MSANVYKRLGSPKVIEVQSVPKQGWNRLAAMLAILIASMGTVAAATFSWDGGGLDAAWTTAENWTTDVAPPNDGSADIRLPYNAVGYNITLYSAQTLNSLLFQNLGSAVSTYVLSGADLAIDNDASGIALNVQKSGVTVTINCNVALTRSSMQNIGLASGDILQFGGTMTAPNSGAASIKCNYNSTAQVLSSGALDVADLSVQGTSTAGSYALTLQLDHNEALADIMTLRLVDSANTKAKLNLNFTGKERVLALTINGVSQPNETFGGVGSGAQNIDATRFSGSGMLIVGPPPPACTAIVIR
jgi:hypothetical protein